MSLISLEKTLKKIAISGLVMASCLGAVCESVPVSRLGKFYNTKREDLIKREYNNDEAERIMNLALLSCADKLSRAIQPDYFKFPEVDVSSDKIMTRESKKKLGVIDLYSVDRGSGEIKVIDSYVTDFLIASLMSNIQLGENFRVLERYKLNALLREYDTRRGIREFDPREAIKEGKFKGVDAVLTGSIYFSRPKYDTDYNGNKIVLNKGGVQVIIRLIDVIESDVVGNAAESFGDKSINLVIDWVDRKSSE